jgi:hypothetical protein
MKQKTNPSLRLVVSNGGIKSTKPDGKKMELFLAHMPRRMGTRYEKVRVSKSMPPALIGKGRVKTFHKIQDCKGLFPKIL